MAATKKPLAPARTKQAKSAADKKVAPQLADVREHIDQIDRQIQALIADRAAYALKHLRKDHAHARIIQALGRHLKTGSEAPTPFAEIDYVIRNCDTIGREIDRQVERLG